ncbi:MAG: translocation/assembly module TamB domain-containing protein, partial [Bacteroidales bacterium]|nr:translocation/assembly module TamB domain-containing protein [Bacteroidales bacterium]
LRESQLVEMAISTKGEADARISAKGFYEPRNDDLDFNFNLYQLNLIALQPYLNGNLEEMNGLADVNLTIDGKLRKPFINGIVSFNNGSAMVSKTKTKYFFENGIRIYKNDLFFDDFDVYDSFDNKMTVEGNMTTSNFNSIFLNLDIEADNFNFLSTTRYDNEQFYGDVFASATARLSGPIEHLDIKVSAISEKNTNLNLPLYNALKIQTTDYIIFVQKIKNDIIEPPINKKKDQGITLDMDLEITSNTSAQLIFDPKVGDIIEVSANGKLKVELDDNGDFSVFGDVLITDGEYLFTLQNVINKRFRVKPGGTIAWNGAPTSATVNLDAVYETKASIYSLAPEPTEDMKKRIPVYCLLALQGDLANPTIIPNIELPTAEPETRSIVETSIGTDEELMRQFISLLIINNFISSSEFNSSPMGTMSTTGVAGVTASELLSNQLSNWLSQISNDFDIGVNYRPGDAISSDEVEVALSTQLLNDRIIFSGNLDVVGDEVTTPSGEASNIVGDFDLEFVLTDKISLKAFNRVNDDRVVRPSLYTQGIGVQYRSEFNSFSEIFKRRKQKKSKEEKEKKSDKDDAAIKEDNPKIQNESP